MTIESGAGLAAKYDIGLFNYCSGNTLNASPDFCSGRSLGYYFNPLQVWNLESTPLPALVPKEWNKALDTYHTASKWMSAAYIAAVVATLVTLLLGILSFFLSRISTFITSIACGITTLFTIVASATATAVFIVIQGVVEEKLHKYGVHTHIGGRALEVSWLAAIFAFAAGIMWSCGCCCGRDEHRSRSTKRQDSLRGRSAYERVPSPFKNNAYAHQEPMPLHDAQQQQQHWPGYEQQHGGQTGYEAYRADNRV